MTLLRQAEIKKINFRRSATVVMALLIGEPVLAASQKIGDPPEASNIRLVGFNDLQGRSAIAGLPILGTTAEPMLFRNQSIR